MREQRLATKARTYDFGRAAGFFYAHPTQWSALEVFGVIAILYA